MGRFSPLNRGGNVPAAGKAGTPGGVGNWLGKLGQAALGTGRMRLMIGMQNQRFQQRQQLQSAANEEWDRRRKLSNRDKSAFRARAARARKSDPMLTSYSDDKQTWAAPPRPAAKKKTGPKQTFQGPTNQIIALRKAHEAGDGVMSHEDAMGHRGYATAFQKHIAAGGTEHNFLDNYTLMGNKSRRQNPGDNRNDSFNGGGNN